MPAHVRAAERQSRCSATGRAGCLRSKRGGGSFRHDCIVHRRGAAPVPVTFSLLAQSESWGAYNTVKHACVAARIGDDAKRGAANMSILASRATKLAPVLAATPCGLARVLAHGFVASPLLSRSKRRALLRAPSQNRASASRVLRCYRLLRECASPVRRHYLVTSCGVPALLDHPGGLRNSRTVSTLSSSRGASC